MRNLMMAGAAALAFAAVPTVAQDVDGPVYDMTDAQEQMFMTWEDEKRIAYERWPAAVQAYYWTLRPVEVDAWWILTDDQRIRIYEMTPQQRTAAWAQIAAQMNNAATVRTPAAAAATNIRFVSNAHVQNIPMDQASGDIPICSDEMFDNCINAWEAGKRGPGVDRPLDYWPGRPESEMDDD